MQISQYDEHQNRPCIRCTAPTCSHTDYPLCTQCFRYLTVAYCGPRHLTEGIRDGLAALAHYRQHCGLTEPAPTNEVWTWLCQYLACRGAYARLHRGRLPAPRPVETDTDRRRLDNVRVLIGSCRSPGQIPAPG